MPLASESCTYGKGDRPRQQARYRRDHEVAVMKRAFMHDHVLMRAKTSFNFLALALVTHKNSEVLCRYCGRLFRPEPVNAVQPLRFPSSAAF